MPSKAEIEKRIATFGDPKSNGKWRDFVEKNKAAEKAKPRQENVLERIGRINYEFGNSKERPKHLDNKSIYSFEDQEIFKNNINKKPTYPAQASPEAVGKLAEKLEKQRQMTGGTSLWDDMKATAKTPAEKKEIRETIWQDYKRNGAKNMAEADLRWIGKSKYAPVADFKIDASGISDSINNYINATRVNAPVAPAPKKKDPDLDLGLAALLGVDHDN